MNESKEMAAISVWIDPSRGRATITIHGEVRKEDIVAALDTLYHEPRFQSGMSQLWDIRHGEAILSPAELTDIISFVYQHTRERGKGRSAVVTGREVDYGMARIAQVHVEEVGIELMVFRELDEAEQWLEGEGEYSPHLPATGQADESESEAG